MNSGSHISTHIELETSVGNYLKLFDLKCDFVSVWCSFD